MDSIILIVIGGIFLSVGINIILGSMHFKRAGKKIAGRVKAIERYISSHTDTNNHNTRTVMYCAIVEYTYKEKPRIVKSIGANEIRHKLGQKMTVFLIESKKNGSIQAKIDDSLYYFMGYILSSMGLLAIAIYSYNNHIPIIFTAGIIAVIFIISSFMPLIFRKFSHHIKSGEDEQRIDRDSVIIDTKADYLKEVESHALIGNIIALIFTAIALFITYQGYSMIQDLNLTQQETNEIFNNPEGFIKQLSSGNTPDSWIKAFLVMGAGILSLLLSFRSLYYMRKKYGGMLKR